MNRGHQLRILQYIRFVEDMVGSLLVFQTFASEPVSDWLLAETLHWRRLVVLGCLLYGGNRKHQLYVPMVFLSKK